MLVSRWQSVVAVALATASVACSDSSTLTRAAAEKSILASKEWDQRTYRLRDDGFDNGVTLHLWSRSGEVRPTASNMVTEVKKIPFGGTTIATKAQTKRELQITGITDVPIGDNMKEVQFSYSNAGLPMPLRGLAAGGGTGVAVFRKYDDGWRLETVHVEHVFDASKLSASESDGYKKAVSDIQLEASKKRAQLLAEWRVPTTTVRAFDRDVFFWEAGGSTGGRVTSLKVSDVGITMTLIYTYAGGPMSEGAPVIATLTFGDISTQLYASRSGGEFDAPPSGASSACSGCAVILRGGSPKRPDSPSSMWGFVSLYFMAGDRDVFVQTVNEAQSRWKAKYEDVLGP